MIRVAIQPADAGGCGFYRLFQPLIKLRDAGEIELVASIIYRAPDRALRVQPVGNLPFEVVCKAARHGAFALTEGEIEDADVVVIQKAGGKKGVDQREMSMLDTVKRHARKFIYEIDDDLWSITPTNPAYREEVQHNAGYADRMRDIIGACRLATVTTPHLKGVVERRTRQADVRVIPNCVDPDLWKADGGDAPLARDLRVGYIASRNHVEDMAVLVKPWKTLASKFSNITFVLAGAFDATLKAALGDRLEVYPDGVPLFEYPQWARRLRLDVAVAPLVDTVFARSKSNLKWMEGTMLGCPVVCSDVEPYRRVEGPLLCRNANDWVRHIAELLRAPAAREAAVAASQRSIYSALTADHGAAAWLSVITEVCAP